MTAKWAQKLVLLSVLIGFSALLFKPFCHALFRCGCQALWAAGSKFCNVHTPGIAHCPFCSTGWLGANLPRASVWLMQSLVVLVPSKLSWKSTLTFGILAFVVMGTVIGFFFAHWTGYPIFLIK